MSILPWRLMWRRASGASLISVFSVNSEFMVKIFCYDFVNPSNRSVLFPIFASLSKAVVGSLSHCR
jgi:hypothetical protein